MHPDLKKAYEEYKAAQDPSPASIVKLFREVLKIKDVKKAKKTKVANCRYCNGKATSHSEPLKSAHASYAINEMEDFIKASLKYDKETDTEKFKILKLKNLWISGFVEGFLVAKTRFRK